MGGCATVVVVLLLLVALGLLRSPFATIVVLSLVVLVPTALVLASNERERLERERAAAARRERLEQAARARERELARQREAARKRDAQQAKAKAAAAAASAKREAERERELQIEKEREQARQRAEQKRLVAANREWAIELAPQLDELSAKSVAIVATAHPSEETRARASARLQELADAESRRSALERDARRNGRQRGSSSDVGRTFTVDEHGFVEFLD